MKSALIIGITGQDGAYLAKLLADKGYTVAGTSRDAPMANTAGLAALGVADRVAIHSASLTDFRGLWQVIEKVDPDEVYNLAGQSSVGLSFEQPLETFESVAVATINILELLRLLGKPIRLYNACSSECFGNSPEPASEDTPFKPRSPYAVAKAASYWSVANYREAYGLYACSGILTNHESPLRPARFVTRKIVSTACRIAAGSGERLSLGNTGVVRDWGWAGEYVDAMWRMLQQDAPEDFLIATGKSYSLQDFTAQVFAELGLDHTEHVDVNSGLYRPTDILVSRADPSKARERLGWQATMAMPEVARAMVKAEREQTSPKENLA
ncbi:GDP-mannose 4,6-dehydratase [Fundidesulfovibrio terrae]|uniref:GDP-mannose 4,6-dehydratase n=1 Tax=Fundidesulfovibrio terrae TaxID=2922866 RepID=UPI001FAFE5E8|nr:GDP-mannose 4,6-dehydratase [Fundidesulfovibrio terrae]